VSSAVAQAESPTSRSARAIVPIVASRSKQIQELLAQLQSRDVRQRETAIARMTLLGERVVASLVEWLPGAETTGRLAGLEVLERVADSRAAGALLALCDDPDEQVACRAIELAPRLAGAKALAPLAGLLGQSRPQRRLAVLEALGALHRAGIVEAIEPLLSRLLDESEEAGLRVRALELLAETGRGALAPVLRRLRSTPCAPLAERLAALSQRRGSPARRREPPPALRALLRRPLRPEHRRRLRAALQEQPELLEDIHLAVERSDDPLVLRTLCELLEEHGSVSSAPRLHALIRRLAEAAPSPDVSETRARAHLALAGLGSRLALYDLRDLLQARPVESLSLLLTATTRIGDASLLPALAGLATEEPSTVPGCAAALAAIIEREHLRRNSRAVKAVPQRHRPALERLWQQARGQGRRISFR
jgi:hypothetical protein